MWTLGLALWMFDRDRQPLIDWLEAKFRKSPEIAGANVAALNAGHAYGETAELGGDHLKQTHIPPVPSEPGLYRTITGAEAVSLGLVAGAQLAELPMFFGGYPITPASAILHHLAKLKEFNVSTFQAEDEIAAICAANRDPDGSVEFAPFAMLFNGNPYELLNPPNPEGGFFSQEEVWGDE